MRYDAGYYSIDKLLNKAVSPTVIYAAYSHIAVGMLQRITETDKTVPDSVSVICMDDIKSLPYYPIELSCIKMHLDDLALIAVRLLFQRAKEKQFSAKQNILIKREFFVGKTIKRI